MKIVAKHCWLNVKLLVSQNEWIENINTKITLETRSIHTKKSVEAKPATDWGRGPAYSRGQWDICCQSMIYDLPFDWCSEEVGETLMLTSTKFYQGQL